MYLYNIYNKFWQSLTWLWQESIPEVARRDNVVVSLSFKILRADAIVTNYWPARHVPVFVLA